MGALGRLSHLHNEVSQAPRYIWARRRPPTQRQTRLTKREIERLKRDRAAGATIEMLASIYGIHRTTVMKHLSGTPWPTS